MHTLSECSYLLLQLQELLITTTLKHEMPELEQEHGILIKQKVRQFSSINFHQAIFTKQSSSSNPHQAILIKQKV
jgi:hypothetical protein